MGDADLDRIIEQLERRKKLLDEMIERSVANSAERERLLRINDTPSDDQGAGGVAGTPSR